MMGPAARRVRALAAAALALVGAWGPPVALAGLAGAAAAPLAIDFSGDGNVTDAGTLGVVGAEVEVTLWASTGIAAGPATSTAGPGGSYAWAFSQAPQGSLLNLTIRAWLPWDPNVSTVTVFDVSNGTPQQTYPGVALPLPFAATEDLGLSAPMAAVVLPRGRQVTVEFAVTNVGNVSVAHPGFGLGLSPPNASAVLVNASAAVVEERPGTTFRVNATFSNLVGARIEDLSGTLWVESSSGTNFTFPFVLRVVAQRNAAVVNVTTAPSPPDEGRGAQIRVAVANTGADLAPLVTVQVQAFYATLPDVYVNSTTIGIAPNSTTVASLGWTPLWSPDPVTIQVAVSTADDFDPSDDAGTAFVTVNSTNVAPAVTFSSPTDGARMAGNLTVAGTAQDPEGSPMTLTVALDGGAPLFNATATAFGFVLDLSPLADGPHTLTASATDDRGLSSTAHANFTVLNRGPNAPPTVTVDAPRADDTVGASFNVSGTASDERFELASVLVSVDGGPYQWASGTTVWALAVDGSALGAGPHTVRVRAFDSIDYSAVTTVDFHVNATAPTALALSSVALDPTPSVPGAPVNLTGLVAFDTLVFAAGANVTAQIRGFTQTTSALADARGGFLLVLGAPQTPGDYTVDVTAIGSGLQANATAVLRVSISSLPDIELLPTGFSISPDPPPPQTSIRHTIQVGNTGAFAQSATLRVWDGPRGTGTLLFEATFSITTSHQEVFQHTYAPGVHNLTIVVEDVAPQEGDLNDNAMTIEVAVPDAPDFAVMSVTASTPDIVAGSNITFLVVVENQAPTPGFVLVELWDGVPLAANSTKIRGEQVAVAGGARERLLLSWTPTEGTHLIVAQAVLASPAELILTNNQANLTVTVRGPGGEPAPPFLPGFGGVGALAAVASMAAARRRARGGPRLRRPRAAPLAVAILLAAAAAAAFVPAPSGAGTADASAMPGPLNGVCQTCHVSPQAGGPLNPFGADYAAEKNTSAGAINWSKLGGLDSDADGASNALEWQESYLPGDPNSNPRTGIRYSGFGGASGLLTGLVALLAIGFMGAGLGYWMAMQRKKRQAAKAAKAQEPPAPKP